MSTEPGDLRALSERIEQMREEERARIARELHDELGGLLTGIKLDFTAARVRLREIGAPGDIVDRLQSAMGQIDIGLALVRRIASDLRPPELDHADLAGALEQEARRVAARSGLHVRLASHLDEPVPAEPATAAFRIFQEALTNAVRHARARRVHARVSARRGRLALCVRDDGRGIPVERITQGLGLLGMRERAQRLGGEFRIRSRPGKGTVVFSTLPLCER